MTDLGFDRHALVDAYLAGQNERCADLMIEGWRFLDGQSWSTIEAPALAQLTAFVRSFLMIFVQPDFVVSDRQWEPLIRQNLTISNIVAITPIKTTDEALRVCKVQKAAAKLMVLANARNTVNVDRGLLFKAHPALASLWYCLYATAYRGGLTSETVVKNLQRHYRDIDPALKADYDIHESYFGSTYIDGQCDKACKQAINRHMRLAPTLRKTIVRNKPDPKKVAVISAHWRKGHSVYRTLAGYVEALKPDYHVTLVALRSDKGEKFITDGFDEVRELDMNKAPVDLSVVQQNEWAAVYYPDVGMTLHSVLLSSLRLAPVQIVGTGHPVSTWGSEVDYFVSGQEVESKEAAKFYSERLILLPGMGAVYNRPDFKMPAKDPQVSSLKVSELREFMATGKLPVKERKPDDPIRIACSWYGQKINAKLIAAVQRIIKESKRPIIWRIYSGSVAGRNNGYLAYVSLMREALKEGNVELHQHLPYDDYMASMAECDFGADCWHFGGSNTVSDLLHLRKPVVCLNGERWYGRIGSALMRRAMLPEMICENEEQYVKTVARMANEDEFRAGICKRLEANSLDAVYSRSEAASFKRMMDYLITNQASLKNEYGNEPLVIE